MVDNQNKQEMLSFFKTGRICDAYGRPLNATFKTSTRFECREEYHTKDVKMEEEMFLDFCVQRVCRESIIDRLGVSRYIIVMKMEMDVYRGRGFTWPWQARSTMERELHAYIILQTLFLYSS